MKWILADQGAAKLPILTSADEAEKRAGRELAHYLKRITGATFALEENGCGKTGIRLVNDPALAEETLRIVTDEKGLLLAGGSVRGLHYAAYAFLEDVLGVRFFTEDVTVVPRQETLAVEDLDITDKPALEYRQLDGTLHSEPDWRAHNRLNSLQGLEKYGGGKFYALFVHTFNVLVPPEKYFDAHPEYYSMIDGVRTKEYTQLCLTNPEVLAIAIENVKQTLRAHPGAELISVSQNDWYNPCQCPECAKIDAEEGSHAGTLIRFVNAIAEAIEEEFPKVVVDTLAYQYTRTPPKVTKPRHNVCVRLCSIECCFGHPLETCNFVTGRYAKLNDTSRASFQEDLIGWGKICDRIYIWDYVTNFRHYWLPFPNLHVIGPNMQFFVKNGVKGVYEEGNYQGASPDVNELRQWLIAKLLWNPDFDVEQGIYDFTEAVYGPAAPEIRAYIRLLIDRVTEGNIHFGIYEGPDVDYLDAATMEKAHALLAAAQAKGLTLEQRLYVEKVALSLEFVEVGKLMLEGVTDDERIDKMLEKGRALGIFRVSESAKWGDTRESMLNLSQVRRDVYHRA